MIAIAWTPSAVAEPVARRLAVLLTGTHPGPLHHRCSRCGSVRHGQPYYDEVAVSIAHAEGITVVAVSTTAAIGVDVEPAAPPGWTEREAVGKAYGVGITREPAGTALVRELTLPGLGHPVALAVLAQTWPEVVVLGPDDLSREGPVVPDDPATR